MPTALTSKSVNGSRAAQSCEGCAAVWITSTTSEPYSANSASMPVRSRMSIDACRYRSPRALSSSPTIQAVEESSPKNTRRMSLSMPTTSRPSPAKCSTACDPINPAEPVTTATDMLDEGTVPPPGPCLH